MTEAQRGQGRSFALPLLLFGLGALFTSMGGVYLGIPMMVGVLIWQASTIAFVAGRASRGVQAAYEAGKLTKQHDLEVAGATALAEAIVADAEREKAAKEASS